ncbi:MAG: alpha-L-arabinofuranosidase C-terminal domain-containing protein [Chloroflexota bacterium]
MQARSKSKKRHYLCFDEWNVWYRARSAEDTSGSGKFAPPLIEEHYNLEDALVVAGFLNSFIRHADVLKIANIAQIVNVIAPILTRGDEMLLQTIYYPFLMYAQRRDGIALQPVVKGPGYESARYGYVNDIDTSAILGDGLLHIFLVNRSIDETAEIEIDHCRGKLVSVISAEVVSGLSPDLCNTYEYPYAVCSQPLQTVKISEGKATVHLPPLSVAAITIRTA